MYRFPERVFPSHLNDFARCPFKFRCKHDTELKAEYALTPDTFVGKAIHAALKSFFDIKEVLLHERKPERIGQLLRHVWGRIRKGHDKGYWSKVEREKLFGSLEHERARGLRAIRPLENYLATTDLSVIPLALEQWLECRVQGQSLGDCIDRIDQDDSRAISVWDYKTGKLPYHNPCEDSAGDYQLPVYAIIAAHRFPFAETVRAGLIYVEFSEVYVRTWTRHQLAEVTEQVLGCIDKIRSEREFRPSVNGLCRWCEYLQLCPERDNVTTKAPEIEEVGW
jgi:RecB family exonuclease